MNPVRLPDACYNCCLYIDKEKLFFIRSGLRLVRLKIKDANDAKI
jgi:hypothetical protein